MSPVEQSTGHVGRAAAVALVGIVVALGGIYLAARLISPNTGLGDNDVQLGDATFQGGSAERLAAEIDDRGPIIYGDVSGRRDRDIILQHLGDDPETGWYAFLAAPLDQARDCTWTWVPERELFVAKCDESLTAPADGEGLPQFPVTVIDGRLDVNLNPDADVDPDSDDPSDPDSEGEGEGES